MALQYTPQSPVLVDAELEAQQLGEYNSSTPGMFVFKGHLYTVEAGGPSLGTAQVWQSFDGVEWITLDAQNAPSIQVDTAWTYDQPNARLIFCLGPAQTGFGQPFFVVFNLLTGTWGNPFGLANAPMVGFVNSIWVRPDGSWLIITFGEFDPMAISSNVICYPFNPVTKYWGGAIDALLPVTLLAGWVTGSISRNAIRSCMDTLGNVYIVCQYNSLLASPPYWNGRVCFGQVSLANTASNFYDFPGQNQVTQVMQSWSGTFIGVPIYFQGQVLVPVTAINGTAQLKFAVWILDQLGWTLNYNLDPANTQIYPFDGPASTPGMFVQDSNLNGNFLYLISSGSQPGNNQQSSIRLVAYDQNLNVLYANWIYTVPNPSIVNSLQTGSFPMVGILHNQFLLISSDVNSLEPSFETTAWFGDWANLATRVVPPPPIPIGIHLDCRNVKIHVPQLRS